MPELNIIVACDINFGIGKNGKLPWPRLKEDLYYFKTITEGSTIIMGSKTWKSIGSMPLQNRTNIVISNTLKNINGIKVFNSFDAGLSFAYYKNDEKIFIIGGSEIYSIVLDRVDKVYLTQIFQSYDCDTYFPIMDPRNFKLIDYSEEHTDPKHGIKYRFLIYKKLQNINLRSEYKYLALLNKIFNEGELRSARNGKIVSIFGERLEFNMKDNAFPLMTCRKVPLRWVFEELMWIIRGQTDSKILEKKGIDVWKKNSSREFLDSRGLTYLEEGEIGLTYGALMRNFGGKVDQLKELIHLIKTEPTSRRLIISLWDPCNIDNCALPPCLRDYQFYVSNTGLLSCIATLRSSDAPVALHWNIATAGLLTKLIAFVCDLDCEKLIITIGDAHIYAQHLNSVHNELFERVPRVEPLLKIKGQGKTNIEDFEFEDIEVIGYFPINKTFKLEMIA